MLKTINKFSKIVASSAIVIISAGIFFPHLVSAQQISYDPYGDRIQSQEGIPNANNAVGAPDNQFVSLVGVDDALVIDMGDGEEGTGNLKIHVGPLEAQVNSRVEFLGEDQKVIKSEDALLKVSILASTIEYPYSFATQKKAYRYVKIYGLANVGFNLDAVEATGYIGSTATIDTDGGGTPDREEQTVGLNPENPSDDQAHQSGPATTGANNETPNQNEEVNPDGDDDEDGMPNGWEIENGLNPNENDAGGDLDNDGITNKAEYDKGSDPRVASAFTIGECRADEGVILGMSAAGLVVSFLLILLAALLGFLLGKRTNRTTTTTTNTSTTAL